MLEATALPSEPQILSQCMSLTSPVKSHLVPDTEIGSHEFEPGLLLMLFRRNSKKIDVFLKNDRSFDVDDSHLIRSPIFEEFENQ